MAGSAYSRTARAWAAVFFLVALAFAATPAAVGEVLTALAHMAGLSGALATPGGTLWHVLAISLMVAVTGLAWESAHRPADLGLFATLLAAKLASTTGFGILAATVAPAFLLCALGDGFVALTLWLAWRATPSIARRPVHPGFGRRYAGQAPFYEVWFGKIDVAPGKAFWFRYTLLDGTVREAGTWAIWFDAEAGVVADRTTCDLEELPPGDVFCLPDARLDAARAIGRAGAISWDLAYRGRGKHFGHVPRALEWLGLARSRYCSPVCDARFDGIVRVGGRAIAMQDATGMLGHIDGSRSGQSWTWTHCNAFDGRPDAVFEGLSARILLAGRPSPPLSSFVLWLDGRRYAFSSTPGLLKARSRVGEGSWSFSAEADGVTLEGEATAPDSRQVAVVTYTDTDGSHLWCHNSKMAKLRVRLRDPGHGVDATLVASGTAAFELVDRVRPPGPPLL